MSKTVLHRLLLGFFTSLLILVAAWSAYHVHDLSIHRAKIKKDYSSLNNITYGLLSVNAWRDHLIQVVANRIDDFEFTPEQEAAVKTEVSHVLHAIINRADSLIELKQKTLGGKIKKFAVKSLVNSDKIHQQVPVFTETIVAEFKKPDNKAKLKFLLLNKLEQFGSITYDSTVDFQNIKTILASYNAADVEAFDHDSEDLLASLQEKTYMHTFIMLGILGVFVLLWFIFKDRSELYVTLFISSVIFALILLAVGLTTPMIEIDARIKEMTFLLMGENIRFHDQVIFFQSKSIVDVVRVLVDTGKVDSVLVGILILIFSIVFPIGKIMSTGLYLLGNLKFRQNKLIRFFSFKSGKWSMADVYVVAVFMAYIGFKGILDSQLSSLNMKTESMASISTNQTSLQPGYILFVAFVLFGLTLSVILKKITARKKRRTIRVKDKVMKPSLASSVG